MSCSPLYNSNNNTCYSLNDLKEIAKKFNNQNTTQHKIKLTQNKQQLYKALVKANYNECGNNEYCWLKQNYMYINNDIKKFLIKFRPSMPDNWKETPNYWLNTYNLINVMVQYEDKYKNFKFLGVHPIDFSFKQNNICISENMCNININDLYKKKIYKLGGIFNLDRHYQSGSHWVSLFANINLKSKNYGIYYYDSNGRNAPLEIRKFALKLITENFDITKKKMHFFQNNIRHQLENSECGMFSLYFLDQSLKNINFNKFIMNKYLNDKFVFNLRNKFFNKINSI